MLHCTDSAIEFALASKMITRTLKATSEDGATREEVTLSFSETDVQLLEHYLTNCDRLKEARLLKGEFPRIKNITWTAEAGLSFTLSEFSYGDVCELLHLARPIFLSREPVSFEKATATIGRQAKGTAIAQHLKFLRSTYERGDYQPYFQVTVGGVPLFEDETLKRWLNGVEYHQDKEKAEIVKDLESSLAKEVARGIFVSQLSGRVRAALMLGHLASLIARPEANKALQPTSPPAAEPRLS
ncbi:hypothetical protein HF668_08935 [Acidithiobacillus ferridurans]|uniref:hypothetical protein n=1 Tax=Acidithiobacillus ferridurans TaxID=1232575 RepID=UPI001C067EC5|nr:hypothetical protein [Acidithiobacillus ferridurans]MBU2805266.1 hypothetical protein [Acidithiobacillus ferridurans]